MTESSKRRLRAERGGKRLWFTRRRRLRRGEKPRSEATSTGQPGRRAEEQLRCTESPACRRPRAARHRPRPRGHPNCSRGTIRFGGVIERGHGQPGQRERRQDAGPGNRSRVQLRERRSVRRQDRLGGAPLPGNRWWRHRLRSRATGNRGQHGHRPPSLRARRAMCRSSERLTPEDRPVVDRPNIGKPRVGAPAQAGRTARGDSLFRAGYRLPTGSPS